jgi:hypothetical protein
MRSMTVALAMVVCGLAGCGMFGPHDSFTQSDANAMATNLGNAVIDGMNASHAKRPGEAQPDVLVNAQVDDTANCARGGYLHVLGAMTGSLDNNGSGVLSMQLTESIVACAMAAADGNTVTVDGDPYLSAVGTFSYLNGAPSSTQHVHFGGGFRWSFTSGASGSCSVSLDLYLPNNTSSQTTLSGTVCNFSVNASS